MSEIGKRIRARREALGIGQVDLATRIGIQQPYLSGIETGKKTGDMGASVLMGLCRELQLTPEFIMYGEGPAEASDRALLEAELLFMFRGIDPDRRKMLIGMVRGAYDQTHGNQTPRGGGLHPDDSPEPTRPH